MVNVVQAEPCRGAPGGQPNRYADCPVFFVFRKYHAFYLFMLTHLFRRLTFDIFSALGQLVNQSSTQKKCAEKDKDVLLDTSKTDLYKQYLQDLEVRQDQVFTILFQYL